MTIREFAVRIEMQKVLCTLQCSEGSALYDEMAEEYEEVYPLFVDALRPAAVLAFGTIPQKDASGNLPVGANVLYCIKTVGDEVRRLYASYFESGDVVKGMLIDAMADEMLFRMDDDLQKCIRDLCADRGFGIEARLEAPLDIPMAMQRVAWEACHADVEIGVKILESYMFDPLKSICQVYRLTNDATVFRTQHDCRTCDRVSCPHRTVLPVMITIQRNGKPNALACANGRTVLEMLRENGVYFPAVCGGNGRCGKCRIKVIEGTIPATDDDRLLLSKQEIAEGWRLACRAYPKEDCVIALCADGKADFEILSDVKIDSRIKNNNNINSYGVAVDIGTTTIAMHLIDCASGAVCGTWTAINSQRSFGADVISRIQASNEGKGEDLRACIREDLLTGLRSLCTNAGLEPGEIEKIAVAGNTTMIHLLMGYSTKTLGFFPFKPVNIDTIESDSSRLLGTEESTPMVILPGISTFVGADIVSGIYDNDLDHSNDAVMLIDLGTNGEMAFLCGRNIFCTSAAAGPAFEGGNILWGTGSIAGAICSADRKDQGFFVNTIADKAPIGICGTGVMEIVHELKVSGTIDETGLMAEDYFQDGIPIASTPSGETIRFTQKDVREFQLAKAAIRAAMETLLLQSGKGYDDVDRIVLAGGFGTKLNVKKAVAIGLFPVEWKGKITFSGNASLGGAVKYLCDANGREITGTIVQMSKEISLSSDPHFNDLFLEYMLFE